MNETSVNVIHNQKKTMGSTPKTLLKAVTAGRSRQVRLLLDLGSSTDECDECGQTPLIRAIFLDTDRNRDKIMRMLLKKGAKVSHADIVGRTALSWACLYGRDVDVKLLLEFADVDLDLNKSDINGQTALFHSVASGNAATVKLIVHALRKYDLTVDTPDYNGNTPLMHANRLGHDVCASILITDGSARTGNSQGQNTTARKEKWAVSSYRERARRNKRITNSTFPPISNQPQRHNCKLALDKGLLRINNSESDQETESSSEEDLGPLPMTNINDVRNELGLNYINIKSGIQINTPRRNCLQNLPRCGIPPSILVTPTSSTVVNTSSGSDSEVDSVASTIMEDQRASQDRTSRDNKRLMDLTCMYGTIQEQMSPSYRPTAIPPPPEPKPERTTTELEVTPTVEKAANAFLKTKSRKDVEAHKWMHLKRSLKLTGLTPKKDSETCRTDTGVARDKKSALPQISDRKVHLVQNLTSLISKLTSKEDMEKHCNYTKI